jgi:hypothetical protein
MTTDTPSSEDVVKGVSLKREVTRLERRIGPGYGITIVVVRAVPNDNGQNVWIGTNLAPMSLMSCLWSVVRRWQEKEIEAATAAKRN